MTAPKPRWPAIPGLFAALADPRLEGAACAGQAPLFDRDVAGETAAEQSARHTAAARICRGCPVQSACADAAQEQTADGIWGARLQPPVTKFTNTPKKRPKKAA